MSGLDDSANQIEGVVEGVWFLLLFNSFFGWYGFGNGFYDRGVRIKDFWDSEFFNWGLYTTSGHVWNDEVRVRVFASSCYFRRFIWALDAQIDQWLGVRRHQEELRNE